MQEVVGGGGAGGRASVRGSQGIGGGALITDGHVFGACFGRERA